MTLLDSRHVGRLKDAENRYLQAVVTDFTVRPAGNGVRLELGLTGDSQVIWAQPGKDALRKAQPWPEELGKAQKRIDDFIRGQIPGSFPFPKEGFRFRYGNGGTLPIVRMGGKEYFCLIFREIYPIGWNIANGGSDSRHELLHPFETAERELREELLIFDFNRNRRYVFGSELGHELERPEFKLVRNLIHEKYPDLDVHGLEEWPVNLKWLDGPDTVVVHLIDQEGKGAVQTGGAEECFLTITAEDFGIEVDRIAWINVDEEVVFMDGEPAETIQQRLVNAPIGLFEVERFYEMLDSGEVPFRPDRLYHNMGSWDPARLEAVVDRFAEGMMPVLSPPQREEWEKARATDEFLGLCPVTRSVTERHARIHSDRVGPGGGEVFVSARSNDGEIADRVASMIRGEGHTVFLARDSMPTGQWAKRIDDALHDATHMVVVGSSLENIRSGWVEYEWTQFHIAFHSEKKPGGRLVPFLHRTVKPELLPQPLLLWQAIHFDDGRAGELPKIEF